MQHGLRLSLYQLALCIRESLALQQVVLCRLQLLIEKLQALTANLGFQSFQSLFSACMLPCDLDPAGGADTSELSPVSAQSGVDVLMKLACSQAELLRLLALLLSTCVVGLCKATLRELALGTSAWGGLMQ